MKDLKQTYTLHYHLREPYPHKEDIVCTLKWSDRRSYGISIEATGEVMLHLPLSGSVRDAARMAEEKRGWIIEKVLMQRQRLEEAQKKRRKETNVTRRSREAHWKNVTEKRQKSIFPKELRIMLIFWAFPMTGSVLPVRKQGGEAVHPIRRCLLTGS